MPLLVACVTATAPWNRGLFAGFQTRVLWDSALYQARGFVGPVPVMLVQSTLPLYPLRSLNPKVLVEGNMPARPFAVMIMTNVAILTIAKIAFWINLFVGDEGKPGGFNLCDS